LNSSSKKRANKNIYDSSPCCEVNCWQDILQPRKNLLLGVVDVDVVVVVVVVEHNTMCGSDV